MKASSLKKTSNRINNRASKKEAIQQYKRIKIQLKQLAKKGRYEGRWVISIWGNVGWETLVAFRFFARKHKDFRVVFTPHLDNENERFFDADKCTVQIKFN